MVSQRIRQLRKALGLNQAQFGEALGVSRSVITNIEIQRVEPRPLLISHICAIYGVNEAWLTNGEEPMFLDNSDSDRKTKEILELYEDLSPKYQNYVSKQIIELLKLQEIEEKK